MPPRLDKTAPSGRINVVAPQPLLAALDEWRARFRPIPNKSEAARMLIELGLKAEGVDVERLDDGASEQAVAESS